jgi:hypothetical protein
LCDSFWRSRWHFEQQDLIKEIDMSNAIGLVSSVATTAFVIAMGAYLVVASIQVVTSFFGI